MCQRTFQTWILSSCHCPQIVLKLLRSHVILKWNVECLSRIFVFSLTMYDKHPPQRSPSDIFWQRRHENILVFFYLGKHFLNDVCSLKNPESMNSVNVQIFFLINCWTHNVKTSQSMNEKENMCHVLIWYEPNKAFQVVLLFLSLTEMRRMLSLQIHLYLFLSICSFGCFSEFSLYSFPYPEPILPLSLLNYYSCSSPYQPLGHKWQAVLLLSLGVKRGLPPSLLGGLWIITAHLPFYL